MFGFLALPIERYKYAVLLPLLYFPFFSSLRNVLSTALYLGFANLVHGYHCPRSIVTNVLFPRRTSIAPQLRRCCRAIVAPLGLPKYRRPFVTVWCDFQSWSDAGTLLQKYITRRQTSVGKELESIRLTIVFEPDGQGCHNVL